MQIQKPSLRISASLIGKNIKIKEEEYQIRAFVFEARPMDDPSVTELTFLEFVKNIISTILLQASTNLKFLQLAFVLLFILYPLYLIPLKEMVRGFII
jgi:hypothetical protein